MRIEQSVGSYPTADITRDLKHFLVQSSLDRQQTLQWTLTIPVLVGVS